MVGQYSLDFLENVVQMDQCSIFLYEQLIKITWDVRGDCSNRDQERIENCGKYWGRSISISGSISIKGLRDNDSFFIVSPCMMTTVIQIHLLDVRERLRVPANHLYLLLKVMSSAYLVDSISKYTLCSLFDNFSENFFCI